MHDPSSYDVDDQLSTGRCECGSPFDRNLSRLSETDRQALADALREAFVISAPVLSQALSDALQDQFERLIGRGVMGWLKRLMIVGLLGLVGYTYTKSGGFK